MNNATLSYYALKMIEDIRAGYIFSEELLSDMNSFPLVDYLREQVLDSDASVIVSLIKSPQLSKCYLGLNLVNKIQHLEEIQNELILLSNEVKDYERKYFLMWPLLNINNLQIEKHKEIFSFVLKNWEKWKDDYIKFAGGHENILKFSEERFYDEKFPKSKKWVYILSLKALEKRDDIQTVLNRFRIDTEDEMQQAVVKLIKN